MERLNRQAELRYRYAVMSVSSVQNKTPGRVADRGFWGNSLVATRMCGAPVGYQARPWLNQYP